MSILESLRRASDALFCAKETVDDIFTIPLSDVRPELTEKEWQMLRNLLHGMADQYNLLDDLILLLSLRSVRRNDQ